MDLSDIAPTSMKVAIRHPGTGKETGLIIDVQSLESPVVQKVRREQRDAVLRTRNRKMTAEEIDEQITDQIVAAIAGWQWNGDASWGGKKLDLTPENVRIVVAAPWVRKQVEEAVADEAGFFSN
ncbi:MAG: hypothetical protein J0I48_05335 [Devosia sp.]|uniref:hypothetical protein n=1 Tax=Devosia sp. 66-22 TaxID=1895753 RepID=UPI000928902C|nr:hypothetical protein [Devosia sp. 66-22]MBN9345616.1 hypothetical protein [Devosia sp.]OJX50685.1 MAG: hypothetical protein BGO81_20775 [Devosia sp. 66-22]